MEPNALLKPHTLIELLKTSGKLYLKYLVPLLAISATFLTIPFVLGQMGWLAAELICLYFSFSFMEAAMAIGAYSVATRPFFPAVEIIKSFFSRMIFGTLHIAFLQYLGFAVGSTGIWIPFPMNLILITFWMVNLYAFSLAQPIFIIEGSRGIKAFIASFKLTREFLPKTLFVITLKFLFPIVLFNGLIYVFHPSLIFKLVPEGDIQKQLQDLFIEVRWVIYLTNFLVQPFIGLWVTLLYFDLRSRIQNSAEQSK